MARGGSAVYAASSPLLKHSPITSASGLALKAASSLFPARRIEAVIAQRRLFHQTPARRSLFETVSTGDLMLCCLALLGSGLLIQTHTGYSRLPPHIWARTADKRTRNEVEATLSTAFNIARSAPSHRRNDRLREASFLVPYELARLNKKAPDFRLESLGPMTQNKISWQVRNDRNTEGPPLDAKTETRAFLYFPNGSSKATAVFLAINAEYKLPENVRPRWDRAPRKPFALIRAFRVVYADWERRRPSPTGRIAEVERLPIICNFREKADGLLFYPDFKKGRVPLFPVMPMDVTDFGLKMTLDF